jgi:uncharacterized protein YjaG (DUF416 family)
VPFDTNKYYSVATKGEVASVAIKVSGIALHLSIALQKIQSGQDISDHVERLEKLYTELDKMFDDLTGWTKE